MYSNQLETYGNIQKSAMSAREIEAAVLTKAATKLKQCQTKWDPHNFDKLDKALKYNQTIWSIFQAEISKDENRLPKKIKQDILSLSMFVDKRTFEVMAFPNPEKLKILININLNIAAGLRGIPVPAEKKQE